MKRIYLYLLLALVLGIGALWTMNRNQSKSTLEKLDMNFAVPDTASISKIVITETPGGTNVFERTPGSYWKLNSKYKAAPQLIDLLLTTIRNVEIRRPLARAEKETVLEFLKERSRKVEIFVKGQLYKTYYVGDDAPENKGTYFKMEQGEPYVCFLRGFNGFLTPRYHIEEHRWRDHLLFSSTPETLQSVEVTYPATPQNNFKFSFSGKHFHLEGPGTMDTLATAEYLLRFKRVYLEQYLKTLNPQIKDSLLKTTPEWTLSVVDIDSEKSHTLHIFRSEDVDRRIAWMPDTKEMISIQIQNLEPLKKKRFDFVR